MIVKTFNNTDGSLFVACAASTQSLHVIHCEFYAGFDSYWFETCSCLGIYYLDSKATSIVGRGDVP